MRRVIYAALLMMTTAHHVSAMEADVCVYGGTSGGVVAAVQAARMGKSVVLVEPGRHLGGMTSGGLSAVDIGDPRSVGGIAREYFTRLVASYGKQLNWGQAFERKGGPATGGAYSIEPHVAEKVFDEMANEAGVIVWRQARLKSVRKTGARIVELLIDDGRSVRAKMFIDTTYEGDLMAAAGVSYTLTREANAKYGEQYNGIHYASKYKPRTGHKRPGANGRVPGGQGVWDRDFPLDPYVLPGDPSSGLLPLVSQGEPGRHGDTAPGVMAYCFRLCLTTDRANMRPIQPPDDYDPQRYELVARFIEACLANGDDMDLRWFSKHDPLPNDKWDFNTATFGGNLPGASWEWPEASYDRRVEIANRIENYHRGLFHFLQTDPRVPAKVRVDALRFGLPNDEFTDNGGWPHQIYVREGRRMVSDLVLTEHHTFGRQIASKCIGLGSYGTDVHEIRRIVKDGVVIREGKVAGGRGGFGPYNIGYDAIVPKMSECENLLVTFALSASHTAFASIRMEPVLMVTSQSAATAACHAIDADVPVQQVDYAQLRTRLIGDGQVLEWTYASRKPTGRVIAAANLPGIAMDDDQAEFIGQWVESSASRKVIGRSYHHDANSDRGEKSATFRPHIPTAGRYEVRVLYTTHSNRSTKTRVSIHSGNKTQVVNINQRQPPLVDQLPRSLAVVDFAQGASARIVISNEGADGFVTVDGIQLVPVEIATEERQGTRSSGYSRVNWKHSGAGDAATRIASPVKPLPSVSLDRVRKAKYDVCVVEATPAGIACAVRASRQGLRVLLVNRNAHIGGILSSGLGVWDALHEGRRSPIYNEVRISAFDYYRDNYGDDSPQYRDALPAEKGHTNGKFEPRVIEHLLNDMVAAESNIDLLTGFVPRSVDRTGRLIQSVTLCRFGGEETISVVAPTFVDCSYEGDLLPLAKVAYRVGREAREEFNEPHAGRIYMRKTRQRPRAVDATLYSTLQALPLRKFSGFQEIVQPHSSGQGDRNVQAFNYRTVLTSDRKNRIPVERPDDYDPELLKTLEVRSIVKPLPNQKIGWNRPQLVGLHQRYVEGDWQTRQQVMDAHWKAAMALLYFLQHDDSVPAEQREYWRPFGLARDEFADNGHRPYEMYIREARRLEGRYMLTQHDLMPDPATGRPPSCKDSVAITDWYMDSHAVTSGSVDGSMAEGKMMLHAETWPSQIPWRCLLPKDVDNLVVPVCLSATHVAWGAIRLEPTWMQTGEAAGVAIALAKEENLPPGKLAAERLTKELSRLHFETSFYSMIAK